MMPEKLYVRGSFDSRGVSTGATEIIYEVAPPETSEVGEVALFAEAETDVFAAEIVRRYNCHEILVKECRNASAALAKNGIIGIALEDAARLLQACKQAARALESAHVDECQREAAEKACRAAIAKAEGGAL